VKKKKGFIIAIAVIAGLCCLAGGYFILSSLGIFTFGLQQHSAIYYKTKSVGQTAIATITPPSMNPEKASQYGDHVYWPDEIFESDYLNDAQKNDIFSYFPAIDQAMPDDGYITSIVSGDRSPYFDFDYEIKFCRIVDGALIDDTRMAATIQNGHVSVTKDYSLPFYDNVPALDSTALAPMNDIIDMVENLAKQNEDKMFCGHKEPIKGTYTLRYGLLEREDGPCYYYNFNINEYSNIAVEAYSGNVLYEHYWNGVYVD
jgi:hypothetical protein